MLCLYQAYCLILTPYLVRKLTFVEVFDGLPLCTSLSPMKNTIEIDTDGINVYAKLGVKANMIGKIILIALVFLILGSFATMTEEEEIGKLIIPLLIILTLIIAFPVRYLIWNIYGKEDLVVTTKTISHDYDYGIIKANIKTINFHRLGTGIETVQNENGIEKGHLIFYNYREVDNLPELIHETTILIETEKIHELDMAIRTIFENETKEMPSDLNFSLN